MNLPALALLATLLAMPAKAAPSPPVLVEGERVRLTILALKEPHLEGRLLLSRPDSLTVVAKKSSALATFGRADLPKVEVFSGRSSGAKTGATIGVITGGFFFGLVGANLPDLSEGESDPDPFASAVIVGTIGAVAVGAAGALIGSAFRHDRWQVPNSRVRLTLREPSPSPLVGTLLALDSETLTLETEAGPDSTFRRADIARFERSNGVHSNTGKGVVLGAVVGGLVAGIVGSIIVDATSAGTPGDTKSAVTAGGVIVGGMAGGIMGNGWRNERWTPVQVR